MAHRNVFEASVLHVKVVWELTVSVGMCIPTKLLWVFMKQVYSLYSRMHAYVRTYIHTHTCSHTDILYVY